MTRTILLLFLFAATVALAANGYTFSTDPITTDSTGIPLPAGVLKYQFLQSVNGAPYTQVGEGTSPIMTRAFPVGNVCIVATATFVPAVPDDRVWGKSIGSDPTCVIVAAPVPQAVSPAKPLSPKIVKP